MLWKPPVPAGFASRHRAGRVQQAKHFRRDLSNSVRSGLEGDYRVNLHLAPPLVARVDRLTGEPTKRRYGPWMLRLMRLLAAMKRLRGTRFDPFGRSADRRLERALIAEYESAVEEILASLDRDRHASAVEIAALPQSVRGFGAVKARSAEAARKKREELLARFRSPQGELARAA